MNGKPTKFAMYGVLLVLLGVVLYILGVLLGGIRLLFDLNIEIRRFAILVVWYSALPIILGTLFIMHDLLFLVRFKRAEKKLRTNNIDSLITVALTAYNDELSIRQAVVDFKSHPRVKRVIVVSNNSIDRTLEFATEAGALVINEDIQGYGACVHRAMTEAVSFQDTEIVAICEGDMTFRASDIDKFLSYLPHSDVINGTRIVDQLQDNDTQISMFIHYGNFAVAKLLELKYLGDSTLSDVGSTFKIARTSALSNIMVGLNKNINHEFNPYFMEHVIRNGYSLLECPITFHPRVGVSKGANQSNSMSFIVGLRMIFGIVFSWRFFK